MFCALEKTHNQDLQAQDVYDLSFVSEADIWLTNFTSKQTRRTYRTAVSQFIEFHGIRSMDDLVTMKRAHVIGWRDTLTADGESPRTICNRLSAISSLFRHLCEIQEASANPTLGVKRPKVQKNQVEAQALTPHQVRTLLNAPDPETLKGLRDRALLHVFFYTGCRVSEPCQLKVKDYFTDQGYEVLNFIVKGGKRNRVAIHPVCKAALDAYLELSGHNDDRDGFLFQQVKRHAKDQNEKSPIHRATLDQVFRKYAEIVALPLGVTPHSARATFITEALERDHPAEAVQKTVGHSHISTTLSYDKRGHKPEKSASFVVRY